MIILDRRTGDSQVKDLVASIGDGQKVQLGDFAQRDTEVRRGKSV